MFKVLGNCNVYTQMKYCMLINREAFIENNKWLEGCSDTELIVYALLACGAMELELTLCTAFFNSTNPLMEQETVVFLN